MQEIQEIRVQSLGGKDLLEEATHSSILAWKIPWTEEPGALETMGLWKVWYNWINLEHSTHKYMSLFSIHQIFSSIFCSNWLFEPNSIMI